MRHCLANAAVIKGGQPVLPIRFLSMLIPLLLVLFCLPSPAEAVIYTHKKSDDTLFLTNDKRKIQEKPEESEPAPQAKSDKPQTQDTPSPEEAALAQVELDLEEGLEKGRLDEILELFNFFPYKASPQSMHMHQQSVRAFFKLFFKTFGTTLALHPGSASQETLHLARLYSATNSEIKTADCQWVHKNYLSTLRNKEGALSLHVSYCKPNDADEQPWIKDMGLAFVEPTEEYVAKANAFMERYKEEINAIAARWQEQQEREAAGAGQAADNAKESPKAVEPPAQKPKSQAQKPQPKTPPQPMASLPQPKAPQQQLPPAGGMPQMTVPGMDGGMGMGNSMMLVGMLSGTFITIFLAVGIFFYLFYCLCLYVIACKLGVSRPWLSWIPIAQTHPQVLAAGLPGWWTAAIIGAFVLSAVPFVGFLLSLAVLVVFIWLWMRISERLGVNKWLGVLIILPIVQFVYPAWLAFKNDEYRAKADIKNALGRTVLAFILLCALAWAGTTFYLMPMLEPLISMFSGMQSGIQPGTSPGQAPGMGQPVPVQPEALPQAKQPVQNKQPDQKSTQSTEQPSGNDAHSGAQKPAYQSLDAQAYEQLLSSSQAPAEGSVKMPHIRLGPALVKYDTFWADEKAPHFWLKVVLPELPNITLGDLNLMRIEKVLDTNNSNVFDAENSFEKGRFQGLSFHESTWQTPKLEAIRDVHLLPGATEKTLASVSGELILKLPLGITPLPLKAGDTSPQEQHGLQATLNKIEGKEVSLTLSGDLDKHLATLAYDAQGNLLDSQFRSWNTIEGQTTMTIGFEGPPERVELLVASGILEKKYPFTLEL